MIFVTVGTHPQSFERLFQKIEELAESESIKEKIFCQAGCTDFKPKAKNKNNFEIKKFLSLEDFEKKVKEARLVITHAGEGNIGLCLKHKKRMIIVPRLKVFNEHTNDHQLELAQAIGKAGRGIIVKEIGELKNALKKAEGLKPESFEKGRIVELIEEFVKKQGLET